MRLLGPLEVLRDGGEAAVRGTKPRALLTVLALHAGRIVPVDLIAAALWADAPPDDVANGVQVHVSRLRKAIGPAAVLTVPGGYRLDIEEMRVDTKRFEKLAGAGADALEARRS